MTRTEAIKQLQGMVVGADWLSPYMVEALDMAIEALEMATINCVHCDRYDETEDDKGVHSHCRAVEREQLSFEKDTEAKSYSKDSGDLVIEGAKGIPDGLYVIKDGLLFKYKPNGGTVYTARAYHVTERPKGKWTEKEVVLDEEAKVIEEWQSARCSNCGRYHTAPYHYYFYEDNFCPNCGAYMRGDTERC